MICNNCGLVLKDKARFCAGCGSAIGSNHAEDSAAVESVPSPVSALFADPPAQPAISRACVIHLGETATGACGGCGKFYCRECLVNLAGRNCCRSCATRVSAPLPQMVQPYTYHETPSVPHLTQPYPQPYQYSLPPTPSYPYQVPPALVYVKRKQPGVALLLSFLWPGLGQIYNGDVGKGIAFMLGFWVLVWIGIGIVFWIWAMIDAYQCATNINMGRRV